VSDQQVTDCEQHQLDMILWRADVNERSGRKQEAFEIRGVGCRSSEAAIQGKPMTYNINGKGALGKPGWRLFLILLFFNTLVCACSGRIGWMLFWAIAFSCCAHEYGYEHGKTEGRLSRQSAGPTDLVY